MSTPEKPEIALEKRHSEEARLFSSSTARNLPGIFDVLQPLLSQGARVLEIGSGTGEHGHAFCAARQDLDWQCSDPDDRSRESQAAWLEALEGDCRNPIDLDLTKLGWFDGVAGFDALVCVNVIHISPWAVARGLAAGARAMLAPGGLVFLYGPYMEGERTAESNRAFDQSLKSRNPEWGVRTLDSVERVFADCGFKLCQRVEMPANNLSLVFRRDNDDAAS